MSRHSTVRQSMPPPLPPAPNLRNIRLPGQYRAPEGHGGGSVSLGNLQKLTQDKAAAAWAWLQGAKQPTRCRSPTSLKRAAGTGWMLLALYIPLLACCNALRAQPCHTSQPCLPLLLPAVETRAGALKSCVRSLCVYFKAGIALGVRRLVLESQLRRCPTASSVSKCP